MSCKLPRHLPLEDHGWLRNSCRSPRSERYTFSQKLGRMATYGVLMQQRALTQPKQAPARSPTAARLQGMPTAQPRKLQVCTFSFCQYYRAYSS